MKKILFVCSGNYYRSRYAEIYFNHLAAKEGIDWHADSRGVTVGKARNVGPISAHTIRRLSYKNISLGNSVRFPKALTEDDLSTSSRVIAMKESEHKDVIEQNFNGLSHNVEYWNVHDLDVSEPEEALAEIEEKLEKMISELK